MRIPLTILGLSLALATPVRADPCGDLIARVTAATGATLVRRTADFAEFSAQDGIGLTLACGDLSATGAQFKGSTLPEGYFALFGKAGQAVNGLPAETIAEAGRTARRNAETKRHSQIDLGKALVTCSLSSMNGAPVTICAAIDKGDRT
ncbi:hypothetical protein [Methylobacterium gossipiicola]|uniref:Uncharacterized protein n=1 Tax=Methylobacterium gossipiicola TaxID=582675 RepID=A0A1I2SAP6_9HYPH|nr:hypothetical protein [Methylobacterium gossipiicola]SFG47967.1 hypothetical protein SAMN05192565_10437 [Methylobacterium gossipiicola]